MNVNQFLKIIYLLIVCAFGASDVFAMQTHDVSSPIKQARTVEENVRDGKDAKAAKRVSGSNSKIQLLFDNPDIQKFAALKLSRAERYHLVEKIVLRNCEKPGFMIGPWVRLLPPDEIEQVVQKINEKAKSLVYNNRTFIAHFWNDPFLNQERDKRLNNTWNAADQKEKKAIKAKVAALPKNCFRIACLYEYAKRYAEDADGDEEGGGMQVEPIFRRWDYRNNYDEDYDGDDDDGKKIDFRGNVCLNSSYLSGCNIKSLDTVIDMLEVWDAIAPITCLSFLGNPIRQLDVELLCAKLKKLEKLQVNYDDLSKKQRREIKNRFGESAFYRKGNKYPLKHLSDQRRNEIFND